MTEHITDWKVPGRAQQDTRYKKVNGGMCYAFSSLNNLKKNDNSYAYIPSTGGIKNTRASPVIYVDNFNFKIPTNATITAVDIRTQYRIGTGRVINIQTKRIKLKKTASITDFGVGNDISKHPKWPLKPTWHDGYSSWTPQQWGVTLTPAIVNSANFGFLFQCVGTNKTWVIPHVAKLQMRVHYTVQTATTDLKPLVCDWSGSWYSSSNPPVPLNNNNPSIDIDSGDYLVLSINYLQRPGSDGYFKAGTTPQVRVTSDELLISKQKKTTFDVQTFQVPSKKILFNSKGEITNKPLYRSEIRVYPKNKVGTCVLRLNCDIIPEYKTLKCTCNVTNKDADGPTETDKVAPQPTTDELDRMMDGQQTCIIHSNTFQNCSAAYGASYAIVRNPNQYRMKNVHDTQTNSSSKTCNISKCPYWKSEYNWTICPFREQGHYCAGFVDTPKDDAVTGYKCKLN